MAASRLKLVGASPLGYVGQGNPGGPRNPGGATLSACAAHLDLTRQRVAALANGGNLPRNEDSTFNLDHCRIAYIRFLRQAAGRRAASGDSGAQLREARSREIDLRIAREVGELIAIEDVEAVVEDAVSAFCAELAGLPAACTRDLALRTVIEDQLGNAINRCRKRLGQAAQLQFNPEIIKTEELGD